MVNMTTLLSSKLTPAQQAAALEPATEVLTLACAGSGKSRTLAYRIARLVSEGASPESIVAFTFTNKAADSIKLRVAQALEDAELDPMQIGAMFIGTIDAYCGGILGDMDPCYRQYDQLDDNRLALYLLSRYYDLDLRILQNARGVGQFKTIKQVAEAWKTVNNEMLDINAVTAEDPALGQTLMRLEASLEHD